MQIGGRAPVTIATALFEPRHYHAARNMLRIYDAPTKMLRRYLTASGAYPFTARVRTPSSWLELTLYSPHDLLTVNEIFCREDYRADSNDKVVVDFGSNIGISAAYFLSRGPDVFVYLFEPLPSNVVRLRQNLRRYDGRYTLEEVAVGPEEGEVQFGWEETGRYGGVGAATGNSINVTCRDSTKVIDEIVGRHGQIDILKIDIETLEEVVVASLPSSLAHSIRKIYVECRFNENPLAATHHYHQYGGIAQFSLR